MMNTIDLKLEDHSISLSEQGRVRKMYPLFSFEFKDTGGKAILPEGSSQYFWGDLGNINHKTENMLDKLHLETSLNKQLRERYSDLWISVYLWRNGITLHAWINRGGRDAEAMHIPNEHNSLADPYIFEILADLNWKAMIAKSSNKFFCLGHNTPEDLTEYGFFYFAGKYCKAWAVEHPEEVKRAAQETYN